MKALDKWRKEARQLAILRDGGLCMLCLHTKNQFTPFVHVHHVFGRGRSVSSVKESHTSLMCVCVTCHPQPILVNTDIAWKKDVISTWIAMNKYPYNRSFHLHVIEVLNPIGLENFKTTLQHWADWRKQE